MGINKARRKRSAKPITIREVASRAKVSVATVSRVLNRRPGVKRHLQEAVEEAVQHLGYDYRPSPPAGARSDGTYRIGLVVPTVVNPFHALLLKGISSAALIHHADLVLLDSNEDPQIEHQHLQRVREGGIQGLLYIPFAERPDASVGELIERRFPLVFVDRILDREDICTVSSDNVEGAYQAVTYLLDLGHRDIVFVAGAPHFEHLIGGAARGVHPRAEGVRLSGSERPGAGGRHELRDGLRRDPEVPEERSELHRHLRLRTTSWRSAPGRRAEQTWGTASRTRPADHRLRRHPLLGLVCLPHHHRPAGLRDRAERASTLLHRPGPEAAAKSARASSLLRDSLVDPEVLQPRVSGP